MLRLNVGGTSFTLESQVYTSETSLLSEIASATPPGGEGSLSRSSELFSYIHAFLHAGPSALPTDVVVLRDLYVESAFYRLASLRDAIEAQLIRGGGGDPAAYHQQQMSTQLSSAASRTLPPSTSTTATPPTDTLVAAAFAISKSDTIQRAIAAASQPPRHATTGSQTFPLRPTGLTTADYVGGTWRALYATSHPYPPSASAAPSAPSTPSRARGGGSGGGGTGSRFSAPTTPLPLMSPSKSSHLALNRLASSTSLPDPFGFTSSSSSTAVAAAKSWSSIGMDTRGADPMPPTSKQMEEEELVVEEDGREDALASTTSANSSLSGSIRALRQDESIKGCASAMETLTSMLGGIGKGGKEQKQPQQQKQPQPQPPPDVLNSPLDSLQAAKELIARAMHLATHSVIPPPPPSKSSLVLPVYEPVAPTPAPASAPVLEVAPPLPPPAQHPPPQTLEEAVAAAAAETVVEEPPPAPPQQAAPEEDREVVEKREKEEEVGSLLSALAAIRSASGGASVALAGLNSMFLNSNPVEVVKAGESEVVVVPAVKVEDADTAAVVAETPSAAGPTVEEAPLTFSPLASPTNNPEDEPPTAPVPNSNEGEEVAAQGGEGVVGVPSPDSKPDTTAPQPEVAPTEVPFVVHS